MLTRLRPQDWAVSTILKNSQRHFRARQRRCSGPAAIELLESRELLAAASVDLGLGQYLQGGSVDTPVNPTPPPASTEYQAPQDVSGALVYPATNVSANFNQIPQTNDWWSSLLWRYQGEDNTNYIYPHPFVAEFNKANSSTNGLAVAYPNKLALVWTHADTVAIGKDSAQFNIRQTDYVYAMGYTDAQHPADPDRNFDLANFGLTLQGVPFDPSQLKVESYSDWGVTASFGTTTDRLSVTMLQGSPYMYFTPATTKEVQLSINPQYYATQQKIDFHDFGDGTAYVGIPTIDHMVYYGLFGMSGVTWTLDTTQPLNPKVTSQNLSNQYFSLALMPTGFRPTETGFSSGGATSTLTDSSAHWTTDQFKGQTVLLTGDVRGTSTGTNSATTLNDTTQSWTANQFVGAQVLVTGAGARGTSTGGNAQFTLVDTNQNWSQNQFQGQYVVITSGTSATGLMATGQRAKILSNSSNTLNLVVENGWTTVPDNTNTYVIEPESGLVDSATANTLVGKGANWSGNQFTGMYVHITRGTGAGQVRKITDTRLGNTLQIDSNWSIAPNETSAYEIVQAATITGNTATQLTVDSSWKITPDALTSYRILPQAGLVTAADATTLSDSTRSWGANQFNGWSVVITEGTGAGQIRSITANTGSQVTLSSAWTTTPDTTSHYEIVQTGTVASNTATQLTIAGNWAAAPGSQAQYQIVPAGDDLSAAHLEIFKTLRAHAYAEISNASGKMGSYVNYTYDTSTNKVTTLFGADVNFHSRTFSDGGQVFDTPLFALYPHQWKANPDGTPLGDAYNYGASNEFAKGVMKLYATRDLTNPWSNQSSTGLTTTMTHTGGLLPFLPPGGDVGTNSHPGVVDITKAPDPNSLVQQVAQVAFQSPDLLDPTLDSYAIAKLLQRVSNLIPIADQLSHHAGVDPLDQPLMALARDKMLNMIKLGMARYFGATKYEGYQQLLQLLYYNQAQNGTEGGWSSLIPYNTSSGFGAGSQLNDHHFHYGYFLQAAGILSIYDSEFLIDAQQKDAFAGIVKLLARDVANWDRQQHSNTDPVFPFLRYFNPYVGHSYASGHGAFGDGNNQESSTESVNFSIGLSLIGEALLNLGDPDGKKMRDLGVSLYETEIAAMEQYTFNIDGDIFPQGNTQNTGFNNFDLNGPGGTPLTMSAQMWDSGSHNATFFATNYAEAPFSINWLPISASSLFLGRHSGAKGANSYVERNWKSYQQNIAAFANDPTYNRGGELNFTYPVYPGTDWAYEALIDPAAAASDFAAHYDASNKGNQGFETGESAAMTRNWINTLAKYGYVDSTVTATGTALYAVFRNPTTQMLTYTAYNSSRQPVTVTFTDPANSANNISVVVPAQTMVTQSGPTGSPVITPTGAIASGKSTGGNSTTTLIDSTQNWFAGQFTGLQVTILSGTGAGQTGIIVGSASTTLTVSQPWTTTPDATSTYKITKLGPSVLQQPLLVVKNYESVSSSTSTTLQVANAGWTVDQFKGMTLTLTGATGAGQIRQIVSNTADTLTISTPWTTQPGSGTYFTISRPASLGAKFYLSTDGQLTATPPANDPANTSTTVTIPATQGGDPFSIPASSAPNVVRFTLEGVNQTLADPAALSLAATGQFAIWLKDHQYQSSAAVNQIVTVGVRYKWNGTPTDDSQWDRYEIFQTTGAQLNSQSSNAPDTNISSEHDLWNLYNSMRNPVANVGFIGGANRNWQSFSNGTIQVSVWMTNNGSHSTDISINSPLPLGRQSFFALPSSYGSGLSFGSAPDSYQTTLQSNGPRHQAVGAVFGSFLQLSEDAAAGTAEIGEGDQQGVYVSALVPGSQAFALVDITGDFTEAGLDGWIDFNRNGKFDASERITDPLGNFFHLGLNTLHFTVPADAQPGKTYARFRISSTGGLEPTGEAFDGEVEDQVVYINSSLSAFPRTTSVEGFYFVGDGVAKILRSGDQLTLVDPNGRVSRGTLTGGSRIVATDWNRLAGDFDAPSGLLGFTDGQIWRKVRQLGGRWLNEAGQETGISQLGTSLTLTDAAGHVATGTFTKARQFNVPAWNNKTGTLSRNGMRIEWSDGSAWDLIPDLDGNWSTAAALPTGIEQLGGQLTFINQAGASSAGRFLNADQVIATGWGNLMGTLSQGSIHWSDGSRWSPGAIASGRPDLAGLWESAGRDVRIVQSGNAITFINAVGQSAPGRFITNTIVAVDAWRMQGFVLGNTILWSNGTFWNRLSDFGGPYLGASNRSVGVSQLERSLWFTTETGQLVRGTMTSASRIAETEGLRRRGTVTGNGILWDDGRIWTRLPDLRGDWIRTSSGAPTYIEQTGSALLFVSEVGATTAARFTNPFRIETTAGFGQVLSVYPIAQGTLLFSNGWLWKKNVMTPFAPVFARWKLWPFV